MFAKLFDLLKKTDVSHAAAALLGAKGGAIASVVVKVIVAAVSAALAAGVGQ
jgi:hypothetical protein